MYNIFIKSLKTGVVTTSYPKVKEAPPARFRGKPEPDYTRCNGCGSCVAACPGAAISLTRLPGVSAGALPGVTAGDQGVKSRLEVSLDDCIFCGICQKVCPCKAISLTGQFELAVKNRTALKLEGEIG